MSALKFNSYKFLAMTVLLSNILGCAQPAHKNTMPWQLSVSYTEINIIGPNQYLLDGLFYERQGLQYWLEQRQQAGLKLPLLLKTTDELNLFKRRNYFEMAAIAEMAENLSFEVYYSSAGIFQYKTSSQELMSLADNQSHSLVTLFD